MLVTNCSPGGEFAYSFFRQDSMKTHHFLCLALVLLLSWGCKKENRIRRELSGTWEIEKSEIRIYENGVPTDTTILENPGTLKLSDGEEDPTYNYCLLDFTQGYWPVGFSKFNTTQAQQLGYCRWYGDPRTRDVVTFWVPSDTVSTNGFFAFYTRLERADGPGKHEQWLYTDLDSLGLIAIQEVLDLELVDGNGKIQ
jgi:hypothetical protein